MSYTNQKGSIDELMELKDFSLKKGSINFPQYEEFLQRANDISNQVVDMEVNEETVKEAKKTVAELRKITNRLEDKRKEIKNAYLEPYNAFESQIKDITSVIDKVDSTVRVQIRQLEEVERDEKKARLYDIWCLRAGKYECTKYFKFDSWFKPQFLNKTMSISKVEDDMVEYLEEHETNIEFLKLQEHGDEKIIEYINHDNLLKAIHVVDVRHSIKDILQEDIKEESAKEESATFVVYGVKDIALVKRLLKENKINYKER